MQPIHLTRQRSEFLYSVWSRRSVLPAVLIAALIAAANCSSSTSTSSVTTGPTSAKCQITLTASSNIVADGGAGSISVGAQPECEWSVSTQTTWISDLSPASGQGNGTIDFRAAPNAASSAREGEIAVNDSRVRIMQEATPCRFSITPGEQTFSSADGNGSVSVAAANGCTWTAKSNATFVTITSGATGSGNGTVEFRLLANSGNARTGTLTVADRTYTVTQLAPGAPPPPPPCTYTINPPSANVAEAGGPAAATVTTAAHCAWTAASNAPWITVTSGASGTGNGSVAYTVAGNSGGARQGALIIAEQTLTIAQAAVTPACSYTINPGSANVAAGAAAGPSVTVTTTAGCSWTATSNAQFLTVTSGASGNGSGTVGYNVAANSGSARNGTLTIAGHTFTVSQAAPTPSCTYSIDPTTVNVAAGAAAGPSVTVTTTAGCAWTATSNAQFLTVTSGASGNGSGTVGYNVAANSGSTRNGTLTIAGQTFTVAQAAPTPSCSYAIDPTSVNVAAGAGAGPSVTVTTTAGCTWTATSNAQFLTVTAGASGNGNGTVGYNVAANNSGSTRNGTLTIAGRTFTVTQAAQAPSCTYSINPTSANIGAAGGAGPSVTVTTTAGCTWTATSNVQWISEMAGNRNGSGTLGFNVAANNASARSGTLTIAGHTFTVMQASGCTYTLDPTSAMFSALGGSENVRVTASAPNCAWTATTSTPWINITAGASDNGNGVVRFTVSPNGGSGRSGAIAIAGRTFTVTQNGVGGRLGGSNNDPSFEPIDPR